MASKRGDRVAPPGSPGGWEAGKPIELMHKLGQAGLGIDVRCGPEASS